MLKDNRDVFLDDLDVDRVRRELDIPILVVPPTASGLVYGALGQINELPVRRRYEKTLESTGVS
jgi:hypothetical protein